MLRHVFLRRRKAILIVPFVSLVLEKVAEGENGVLFWTRSLFHHSVFTRSLSPTALPALASAGDPRRHALQTASLHDFARLLRFKVEPYQGTQGVSPIPSGNQLAVCTIEKANGLIAQLVDDDRSMAHPPEARTPFADLSLAFLTRELWEEGRKGGARITTTGTFKRYSSRTHVSVHVLAFPSLLSCHPHHALEDLMRWASSWWTNCTWSATHLEATLLKASSPNSAFWRRASRSMMEVKTGGGGGGSGRGRERKPCSLMLISTLYAFFMTCWSETSDCRNVGNLPKFALNRTLARRTPLHQRLPPGSTA